MVQERWKRTRKRREFSWYQQRDYWVLCVIGKFFFFVELDRIKSTKYKYKYGKET